MATWDMIDPVDYFQVEELLILVQSINILNQELYKRQDVYICCPETSLSKQLQFHLACSGYGL